MARFVGKETDVGSELIGRILLFLLLVVVLLVIASLAYPPFGHALLAALHLPDTGALGIGR